MIQMNKATLLLSALAATLIAVGVTELRRPPHPGNLLDDLRHADEQRKLFAQHEASWGFQESIRPAASPSLGLTAPAIDSTAVADFVRHLDAHEHQVLVWAPENTEKYTVSWWPKGTTVYTTATSTTSSSIVVSSAYGAGTWTTGTCTMPAYSTTGITYMQPSSYSIPSTTGRTR